MEDLPRESEQELSLARFAERGNSSAIVERAAVDCYRPVCTSFKDQVCQINNYLPYCNELLFDMGLELREQCGGSLSLVSIDVNLMPGPGPDLYRVTNYLRWLLETHLCITALELSDDTVKTHSEIVLQELPDNTRLKNLTLHLLCREYAHAHLAKYLPRLRSLEVLSCYATHESFSPWRTCVDAVAAVSELLKATKCLTSLTLHGCFGSRQPPKTFVDALAANSTLKCLELETEWGTADPPGPLGGIRATLTRCAEALAQNQTLEELSLYYSLWHPNNWIAFFASLSRNKHLKKLDFYDLWPQDYPTLSPVLEALALTNLSIRVSFFGPYVSGLGEDLMHYSVFSRIGLLGEESVQVDALRRLPSLNHFTSLTLDVHEAGERLFSALANCIRETTTLRELSLSVTEPFNAANNTATSSCWTLLFKSLSANKSIARVLIFSNGNFQHNDRLTRTIGHSRYIRRVSFPDNSGFGNATELVSLLSEAIGENYNLLQVNLCGAKVGVEAKRCLLRIQQTSRRNCGLVERAAAFKQTTPVNWYTASAFEKVVRNPALMKELAEKEDIAVAEVARMIRSRLRSVEGMHDFMRLTGVVKEFMTCAPSGDGGRMQLQDLNDDCWRLVRRYLSFDDVKRFSIAIEDHSTSSRAPEAKKEEYNEPMHVNSCS
ncbi:hypothetical protein MTO96_040919 [Rhipicephalus appendiculatus]